MANAPNDLLSLRSRIQALTGLSAVSVGIVGDPAHLAGGGYHIGKTDLIHIAAYGPAGATLSNIRQTHTDYSVRLPRDKDSCTDYASALDIGADWSAGGRDAWLRFNALLVSALQAGDPALSTVRATNFSPDGVGRYRIDREYGFGDRQNSADSVTIHTHIEWYRDTIDRRQASLDRIAQLIVAAITGDSPPAPDSDLLLHTEDEMGMIPAGFGADESGNGLEGVDFRELTTVITVGAIPGRTAFVTAGCEFGSAKFRVSKSTGNGPMTLQSPVTVSASSGQAKVAEFAAGQGGVVAVLRMRTSATDTADNTPVGIAKHYI